MLKQTNTKFKRRLTVAGLAAIAITALVPAASSSAWGPERKTFTNKSPADYVTFNSITDNAAVGDERNFVRVMEVGSGKKYEDTVNVTPGKEYEVYIYFHNNAMSKLNTDEYNAVGIAKQVRVASGLSTWTLNSSKKVKISGLIGSSNANPTEVWDEAYLTTTSKKDILLTYVAGSGTLHNGYKANGTVLSSKYLLSSDGVYIGENELNGYIPGCAEYSGYITYRVHADQADSKISKTVSKDGKNFYETVDAKPGDTLTYKVEFENTGTLDLTNVTFNDKLPSGVSLVNGTTTLTNTANPNGVKMNDLIGKNGFSTGLYGSGAKATITYKVKVNDDAVADEKCGTKKAFKNQIFAKYNIGTSTEDTGEVYDSSTIYVSEPCEEEECTPGDEDCPEEEDCVPGSEECPEEEEDCVPGDADCPTTEEEEPPLPKTGPGEIALAIVAVVCIATGGVYWYRSQKDLAAVEKGLNKNSDKSKK